MESQQRTQLLDERAVAGLLTVSIGTLRRWRLFQRGPRFVRLGRLVRYRTDDVKIWLDSQPSGGTDPSAPSNGMSLKGRGHRN